MEDTLETRALRRKQCVEIYNDFLERISNQKGKGKKNRLLFYRFIRQYSDGKPFLKEENEYIVIGKFGRREWSSEEVEKSFNEEDREVFREICGMFGAFDY